MRSRIVLALLFVTTLARGQGDVASAEQLFREGRELMDTKNYALACPKLEASQRLDPGAGTLLNLARCYEVAGRTASAWVAYREAESAAEQSNRTSWAESAHAHAEALAPQLVYFTVTVSEAPEGLVVARDGRVVDLAIYGVAVPVDPGPHTFMASAPGHETWTSTVDVPSRTSLAVPALAPMRRPPLPATPASAPSSTVTVVGATGHAQRTVGVVAGATGLAALVVGTVFGLDARSTYDDAIAGDCRGDPRACSQAGIDRVGTARHRATASVALFIAGGVLAAGGAVMYLTAPRRRVDVAVVGSHLVVEGRF